MNTSDQIISAAMSELYQHGFHATGVDQLSTAVGVTKRTLYRYFPSKDDLIAAVLNARDEQFMALMTAFISDHEAAQRPAAYLDFLSAWGQERGFHGCMFINASAEYADPASPPHQQAKAHKRRVLDYLQQICAEAEIDAPERYARQLFLIGEGLIVSTQVSGYDEENFAAARQLLAQAQMRQEG